MQHPSSTSNSLSQQAIQRYMEHILGEACGHKSPAQQRAIAQQKLNAEDGGQRHKRRRIRQGLTDIAPTETCHGSLGQRFAGPEIVRQ